MEGEDEKESKPTGLNIQRLILLGVVNFISITLFLNPRTTQLYCFNGIVVLAIIGYVMLSIVRSFIGVPAHSKLTSLYSAFLIFIGFSYYLFGIFAMIPLAHFGYTPPWAISITALMGAFTVVSGLALMIVGIHFWNYAKGNEMAIFSILSLIFIIPIHGFNVHLHDVASNYGMPETISIVFILVTFSLIVWPCYVTFKNYNPNGLKKVYNSLYLVLLVIGALIWNIHFEAWYNILDYIEIGRFLQTDTTQCFPYRLTSIGFLLVAIFLMAKVKFANGESIES